MKPYDISTLGQDRSRAEIVDDLRRLLPKMEGVSEKGRVLPVGLAPLDAHLPGGGLAAGAMHEVVPETGGDMSVVLGFVAALLGRMPQVGPVLFVASTRRLVEYGRPYGHGLNGFGLDPARVILVETRDELQALWAMEEALRSAAPAAVAGAVEKGLDLKTSQRLHLAAGNSGLPLVLLRPAGATGSSAAATRWRIGAAKAVRDRFGLVARWRWRVKLERCRNGRLGEWLVEWDHAAYHFSLAAPMADLAFPRGTGAQPLAGVAGRP